MLDLGQNSLFTYERVFDPDQRYEPSSFIMVCLLAELRDFRGGEIEKNVNPKWSVDFCKCYNLTISFN